VAFARHFRHTRCAVQSYLDRAFGAHLTFLQTARPLGGLAERGRRGLQPTVEERPSCVASATLESCVGADYKCR
jgi:hypothetical protein